MFIYSYGKRPNIMKSYSFEIFIMLICCYFGIFILNGEVICAVLWHGTDCIPEPCSNTNCLHISLIIQNKLFV